MVSYATRKRKNALAMAVCAGSALFGIAWLLLILSVVLWEGLSGLSLAIFTEITPSMDMVGGGLLNAIVGSVMMTSAAVLAGAPLGILAGTYMAEYGRHGGLTYIVRFINDILLSAPSIVIGLFIYEVLVEPLGGYSGWAGSVALGVIIIPVVVRTTEDMLLLVPSQLREAASALGLPRWIVIRHVAYRAALSGIVTGVLLAAARVSGETAPLLFTALSNNFMSWDMSEPIASLPVVIYNFTKTPDQNMQQLAWTGALLITFMVLAMSIAARSLSTRKKK